ncbi:MAG: tRNA (N(6)-L-threonylcarbamoyladenosine(37)-C(2))-methylthiotransferase MtaB, partial [bacterium]
MKIFLKTFGCRVNQVETQSLLEEFNSLGHAPATALKDADLCVLNTCTVTGRADSDAERFIRSMGRRNPGCRLVVTGCYAQRNREKILSFSPSAVIVSNPDKENLVMIIASEFPEEFVSEPPARQVVKSPNGLGVYPERSRRTQSPNRHFAVTGMKDRTRAFIKIQDGCDMGCSYCVVPLVRQVKKSKPLSAVIGEAGKLVEKGYREIVLCGIRLGIYLCPETGKDLAGLLKELVPLPGDFRIRFSSLEVMELTEELIGPAEKAGEKFCDYFHVPLQSGSDKVLREMGRPYNTSFYSRKVRLLRKNFPNLGLFCDVIAGYPTESDNDFKKTAEFIKKTGFSGLHIFSFSGRPGTKAGKLTPLPFSKVRERAEALRGLDEKLRQNFAKQLSGTIQRVLIEEKGE